MKVVSIVVTYESANTIEACLESLLKSSEPTEVVVVDNSSTDGSADFVEANYPRVHLVRSIINLGFAGGCNLGFNQQVSKDADMNFLLNPDATVESDCLEELTRAVLSDERLSAASPLLLEAGSSRIYYAGGLFNPEDLEFEFIGWGSEDLGQYESTELTGFPTGGAMLIRRSALDVIGYLDASLFLFWEECEWTLRSRAAGYHIAFVPSARAQHIGGHSTGGYTSPLSVYYFRRNQLHFFRKVSGRSSLSIASRLAKPALVTAARILKAEGIRRGILVGAVTCVAFFDFWRGKRGRSSMFN